MKPEDVYRWTDELIKDSDIDKVIDTIENALKKYQGKEKHDFALNFIIGRLARLYNSADAFIANIEGLKIMMITMQLGMFKPLIDILTRQKENE